MSEPRIRALQQEAEALIARGQPASAMQRLEQVIALDPADGDHWCALARLLARQRRHAEALACLERGVERDPGSIACRSGLGHLLHELSRPEEALHWHGQALRLQPDSLLLQLNHLYVLPLIAASSAQIDRHRERLVRGTEHLLRDPGLRLRPEHASAAHTFLLPYHGRNDRVLLRAYAELQQRGVAQLSGDAPGWPVGRRAGRSPSRPRLGFLSAHLHHHHSNTRAFEGLIRGLDRARFEVVLLPIAELDEDMAAEPLVQACDQVVPVPQELPLAWQRIAAVELDLLFYTDIGMHPFIPFLAARRLAPVQVCGWGIPQSSGYRTIDHYISSQLVEPEGAQDHYNESLITLPGLPCCYLGENLPPLETLEAIGRDYFFLPDEGTPLIGCLQHLQKFHPDFDAIVEALARALPQVVFVLVEASEPGLTERFLERIAQSAPAFREQLVLLQRMSRRDYLALARCLDLLLDPIHYGSGITMFETMITGTPTVCLEGPFLRSRIVAAAYRRMGISDAPIATSAAGYVELAVRLMEDGGRRQDLRRQILQRARTHLLDDRGPIEGFEAFASEVIARQRQDS